MCGLETCIKNGKYGADSRKRTEEMQSISEEGGVAMKARVNEGCISCGACVATCPEVFRFDENDLAVAYADVTDETEAQAKEARDGCPVDVIDSGSVGGFSDWVLPVRGRGKRWQSPV